MAEEIVPVSDADFRTQVLLSKEPVLVAFRAGWCVPSQQMAPVIDKVASKFRGRARIVSVELGPKTERLCRAYGVSRLPVVMVFRDGTPADFIGGVTDEGEITKMLDAQLQPVVDLGEHNFEDEVLKARLPVLVHFWAAWCKPSLEMDTVINTMAESFRGRARVARLEMRPDTARLFAACKVRRIPTTVVFFNGQIQDQIFGALKGGTKTDVVASSCVGLTTVENISQMLERFAV